MLTSTGIVVSTHILSQIRRARKLSDEFALPICDAADTRCSHQLVYTDNRVQLQENPHLGSPRFTPLSVDYLRGNSLSSRILSTTLKDPLCRAAGLKSGYRPSVIDATAGLGSDGISLAWLGCRVILIERSPVVFALLEDGIYRASSNASFLERIVSNIQLCCGNAIEILQQKQYTAETVMIDPMFPEFGKSQMKKKQMRLLRSIVGGDDDSAMLFSSSLGAAKKRVAVKRPKNAHKIADHPLPSHQVTMKSGRFDVYIKDHL